MKLYDIVKDGLERYPDLRGNDKRLMWYVWWTQGLAKSDYITATNFIHAAISPESITRARRKVQENHPRLQASESVQKGRRVKETSKGMFVYHEQLKVSHTTNDHA